jgi:predicted acylesterase/phospholipase RssA
MKNELKNIKEISGSSAGAIIGVALALDIPLRDILDKLLSIRFRESRKV